ncbi:hypothetical protein HPB49_003625 [Dermacentor silvarum]|uniref:Uncharacterized protein n=1 Tax=Dermacentor silvarum TaxID=543639 RepID=A0ACB8CPJ1_DERSI|nr:hypothetical protein HPB49_003625 [Dermacentor silvarum]
MATPLTLTTSRAAAATPAGVRMEKAITAPTTTLMAGTSTGGPSTSAQHIPRLSVNDEEESKYAGDPQDLIQKLKYFYVRPTEGDITRRKERYEGPPQPDMDAPITVAEVYAAVQSFQRNTAPGPDQITNAMIRNLSHESLEELPNYFNEQLWIGGGEIPIEWKSAETGQATRYTKSHAYIPELLCSKAL